MLQPLQQQVQRRRGVEGDELADGQAADDDQTHRAAQLAAIAQAQANLDAKAAQAQWAALDRKIAEEVPVVPLAYRRNSFLHGSGVAGFFVESYPAYPSYQVIGLSAS